MSVFYVQCIISTSSKGEYKLGERFCSFVVVVVVAVAVGYKSSLASCGAKCVQVRSIDNTAQQLQSG